MHRSAYFNWKLPILIAVTAICINCGGADTPEAIDGGEVAGQEEFDKGVSALKISDIEEARDQFDAAAAAAQAALNNLSANTQALVQAQTVAQLLALLSGSQFGGALSRHMLLLDSTPSQTLQNNLDLHNSLGSARLTLSDLIGSGAYMEQLAAFKNDPNVGEPDVSGIPFSGSFLPGAKAHVRILANATGGFMAEDVQDLLKDLEPLVEEIIDLLSLAAGDMGFSFTIPKEIYSGDEDIEVSRADLLYYLASHQLQRSMLSMMSSWSFDIDLGSIYNSNGTQALSNAELVDIFNQNFFIFTDATELAEAELFLAACVATLLDALNATPSVDGFGNIEKDVSTAAAFTDFDSVIGAVLASFSAAETIPTTVPLISLDLNHFFANPPSADTIGIDPFVLEVGKIKFVEAFYNELVKDTLIGITLPPVSFDILNPSISVKGFNDAVFNEFDSFPPFI